MIPQEFAQNNSDRMMRFFLLYFWSATLLFLVNLKNCKKATNKFYKFRVFYNFIEAQPNEFFYRKKYQP